MQMANFVTLQIENLYIPLRVIKEWRQSVRVSIGKKYVILRLPKHYTGELLRNQILWARDWLIKQFKDDESLKTQFQFRDYLTDDFLRVNGKNYTLKIKTEKRKTNSGRLKNGVIFIKLCDDLDPYQKSEVLQKLLSRIIAQDNLKDVTTRIKEINDTYFKKNIKAVKLKNNSSNWGSCSSSGNVNISTRLLFAPRDVQDYVFIHELAHLIEMNHSPRFWKIVRDIMPNYKEKEKWLKENHHLCTF